jgi:hypothetical protein
MNLSESLRHINKKLKELNVIAEAKGHLDHPEDLVFIEDLAGINKALSAIENTANNPNNITIKWDGYPALIFGRGSDGKFPIMDKHMFNRKDGVGRKVYSPTEFKKYDDDRGVNRGNLYDIINRIWTGLAKEDRVSNGYYWGDLLFSSPLQATNNVYTFRPNPNGITYTVKTNSDVGKLLQNKEAGIAVHQYIKPDAISTDQAVSLDGTIGTLKNNSNVAIVPSKMPITPDVSVNSKLKKQVEQDIITYGSSIKDLMHTAPQARNTFNQLFTTYINKRIVSGDLSSLLDGFLEYVKARPMSENMRNKLLEHFKVNKVGLTGVFKIWVDLYKLKMDIVKQLDSSIKNSPVTGHLQDGRESQEGYVSQNVKFIDRMGFSRQNLQGNL